MSATAVIFDLDDTLIVEEAFAMASLRTALALFPGVDPVASEPVALEAIRSVWRTGADHARCLELGLASWEGLWSTFEGNHRSLDGLLAWAPDYRAEAWAAAAGALAVDDPRVVEEAALRFEAAQRSGHPPIDGMEAALAAVSARHRVGLLTNGPSDLQRLKLDQAGLADAFDVVVVSGEAGIGKPSPAVFDIVLNGLGVRPGDAVMVGDSWERDIVGALGAGIPAFWIAAGRPVPVEDPRVTVIDSVRDLDGLLV
jgi:HAD superfamily hydrolase (TIGR01549 family)